MTARPPHDDDRVLILRLWQEPAGSPVQNSDSWRGHVYEGSVRKRQHFVGLGKLLRAILLVLNSRSHTDMVRAPTAPKGSESP